MKGHVHDASWGFAVVRAANEPYLVGRRSAALFLGAAMMVALSACTSGSGVGPIVDSAPPSVSPTAIAPSSVASAADMVKQAALAAYQGMWQDFHAAATTADWQSPALGRYATGTALNKWTRSLYSDHYKGLVTKGVPTHSPQVFSVEPPENPTKVIVADCSDSTHALKHRVDNGQLADDTPGGRRLINGVVERQADGSWKVSDFGVHEVGSC